MVNNVEDLNNVDKISRVIIEPVKKLRLRMHAKLVNRKEGRKENFHKLFSAPDGGKYLSLDIQSFMTLELTEGEWDKSKTIIIDQKNIYQIIKGMKKIIDDIYDRDKGIFAIKKNKETVIYKEQAERSTVKLYNLNYNQRMVLTPAIVYDENEVSYEGVVMFMNKSENYVEFPIDAFEALYYCLEKADLFVYSQELVNYFIAALKGEKVELKEIEITVKSKKKKHPLAAQNEEPEVKGNIIKEPTAEEFFDIENKEEDNTDSERNKDN